MQLRAAKEDAEKRLSEYKKNREKFLNHQLAAMLSGVIKTMMEQSNKLDKDTKNLTEDLNEALGQLKIRLLPPHYSLLDCLFLRFSPFAQN